MATDPLTGLPNRAGICKALNAAHGHRRTALLLASVDRELGATPETLEDMRTLVTAGAGATGTAARVGPWDFAALIPVAGEDEAVLVAEALRATATDSGVVRPGVTLSIGVAIAENSTASHEGLMDAARWAQGCARRRGGDTVVTAVA